MVTEQAPQLPKPTAESVSQNDPSNGTTYKHPYSSPASLKKYPHTLRDKTIEDVTPRDDLL